MEVEPLLSQFNFEVHLAPSGRAGDEGVTRSAAFSEVSGLETTIETVEIREGGYNQGLRRLVGKTSHAPLVLKRGITLDAGLWEWVEACTSGTYPLPYVSGTIYVFGRGPDRDPARAARWDFENAIATKVVASTLDAMGRALPIEELHIVHESLRRVPR